LTHLQEAFLLLDLPPISAGGQDASLAVRNSPTFPNSYRGTTANAQPRTSGFSATPAPVHWEDGLGNETRSADVSDSREKTKRVIDGWKEDAKGVLMFVCALLPIWRSTLTVLICS